MYRDVREKPEVPAVVSRAVPMAGLGVRAMQEVTRWGYIRRREKGKVVLIAEQPKPPPSIPQNIVPAFAWSRLESPDDGRVG